jgi:hypothetical protein
MLRRSELERYKIQLKKKREKKEKDNRGDADLWLEPLSIYACTIESRKVARKLRVKRPLKSEARSRALPDSKHLPQNPKINKIPTKTPKKMRWLPRSADLKTRNEESPTKTKKK